MCAYFLLRDERSGRNFWLGASVFDLRGETQFPDTVHFDDWEGGTQLPILFTALNDRSAWLHPGPGSQHFQDQPFSSYRRFEFRVGASELRKVVRAMKQRWPKLGDMSEEPRDYQLTHFNINPEVYAPSESRGRLGLALRAIRVLIVEAANRFNRSSLHLCPNRSDRQRDRTGKLEFLCAANRWGNAAFPARSERFQSSVRLSRPRRAVRCRHTSGMTRVIG